MALVDELQPCNGVVALQQQQSGSGRSPRRIVPDDRGLGGTGTLQVDVVRQYELALAPGRCWLLIDVPGACRNHDEPAAGPAGSFERRGEATAVVPAVIGAAGSEMGIPDIEARQRGRVRKDCELLPGHFHPITSVGT